MRRIIFLWALLVLLPAACMDQEEQNQENTRPAASETPAAVATRAASATPSPTATATATPEPPQAEISALPQEVDDDGQVVISRVQALEPSWLVLYADDEGQAGEVLAHSAVEEGEVSDVVLSINPYLATNPLHVMLHRDQGEIGTIELPEPDTPLEVEGEVVGATFEVELQVTIPQITVSDQEVSSEGEVVIDSVTATGPGWLAVHADDDGEPGQALGQTPVHAGENNNVVVRFNWHNATRQLHAVLYEDGGQPGRFEPNAEDQIVLLNEEPIRSTFTVSLPPDVLIINQPVVTGEVVVERAVVNESGWVAIYSDFDGFIDRLLGYAPLEAGANENVRIPVTEGQQVTSLVHVLLHQDTGAAGEFEYPGGDPPLRNVEGRPLMFTFQTDAGNYVITRDQLLGAEDTVTVPLVVSDLDTWVAVWSDAEGAPGEVIGESLVEAGVNREVRVTIDAEQATEILHVILHQDLGTPGEFEYPEGPDDIMQREGAVIRSPFQLITSE